MECILQLKQTNRSAINNPQLRAVENSSNHSNSSKQEKAASSREFVVKSFGDFVIEATALLIDVTRDQLLHISRSKADICLARQCAMYVMHTSFSTTYCEVAKYFGRDRTTVSHACRLVEDMRDDDAFDLKLSRIEELTKTALHISKFK